MVILLKWWYGQGWLWAGHLIERKLADIGRVFAVKVLIRTWFAPWKQITSPANFNNFFQAAADNAVSRLIGGFVRTAILFAAFLWASVVIFLGIVLLIAWLSIPLSIIIFPLLAAKGVTL
jgi:hypothetical protein